MGKEQAREVQAGGACDDPGVVSAENLQPPGFRMMSQLLSLFSVLHSWHPQLSFTIHHLSLGQQDCTLVSRNRAGLDKAVTLGKFIQQRFLKTYYVLGTAVCTGGLGRIRWAA